MVEKNALVLKSLGNVYELKLESGEHIEAKLRGKLRLENSKSTNPVAVGDHVVVEQANDEYLIAEVLDRKNYIIRKSVNLSKENHVIAANVDQAFLVCTLKQPETSLGFIDRFLITAEAYSIPVIIVWNKMDLLNEDEKLIVNYYQDIYESLDYPFIETSMNDESGIKKIENLCKDKVSLFSGHSGVGKSTLIQRLDSNINTKTAAVSSHHGKGQHTTTNAQMYEWQFGGYLVDTPGIKGLGMVNMERAEIKDYFREFVAIQSRCKFHNCMHIMEPNCAVLKGIEEGIVAPERYSSYLSMLEDMDEDTYRK